MIALPIIPTNMTIIIAGASILTTGVKVKNKNAIIGIEFDFVLDAVVVYVLA
jgi:hypothetical protein